MEDNYVYVMEYHDYDGIRLRGIFSTKEKAIERLKSIKDYYDRHLDDEDNYLSYKFEDETTLRECDCDGQKLEASYTISKHVVE